MTQGARRAERSRGCLFDTRSVKPSGGKSFTKLEEALDEVSMEDVLYRRCFPQHLRTLKGALLCLAATTMRIVLCGHGL